MEAVVNKTKRTDILKVDPKNIIVKEGFNIRKDMGDIEALLDSIIETGLQVPLKASKIWGEDDKYELVDGHRRFAAIQLGISKGHEFQYIDVHPFKGNDEDKVLSMVITGTGQKALTEIEQAEGIKKLINYGYTIEVIAKKIGKSKQTVYNLVTISNLPLKVKQNIEDGSVTATTVLKITQQEKNPEKAMNILHLAIENVKSQPLSSTGKVKKVTTKDIPILNKVGLIEKLEEVLLELKKERLKNEKVELLEALLNSKTVEVKELVKLFK